MKPQAMEPIASAADVFSDARRQLQAAVDVASDLGLVVPDSFPDAIDHLEQWTTSVDAEARGLLYAGPLDLSPADRPPGALESSSVAATVTTGPAG
jgi:hypothetical protein